jgi:hypothetical protein
MQPIQSCTSSMLSWSRRNLMLSTYHYPVPKLRCVVTGIFTQTLSRLRSLIKLVEQPAVTHTSQNWNGNVSTWENRIKSSDFIWARNFSGKILQQWWQY